MLAALLRVPHLYDMHSSLPQQLTNFAFSRSPLIRRVFLAIERLMIRRSQAVIVICPSLEETVREIDPAARVVLIENAPGSSEDHATPDQAAQIRSRFGLRPATPLVLYTGTFEAYQGLDLLFAAMAIVRAERPDARLLLAGGKPEQVRRAQRGRGTGRASPTSRSLPASSRQATFRRICSPPTSLCRRGRAARTRRSRSISTCGRAGRSSRHAC